MNNKLRALSAAVILGASAPAMSATYVYVSNAEDGDISLFTLQADGSLQAGARFPAVKSGSIPMAVSPDKRFLSAAARAKPFSVTTYSIDRATGALKQIGSAPLAESFPYIAYDKTGRHLLGASYGGHMVSVNPVGKDGRIGEPKQVIPTARHAHAIITDKTNRFVFVPHLGTDQVFQFLLDAKAGKLTANTPPVVQMKANSGPRHIVGSPDNKFFYLLNELQATVSTLALDAKTGALTEVGTASALPADTKLVQGAPRGIPGRNVDNDIWASDIHVTPNGRFVYAAERTSSTINLLSADPSSGKLAYVSSTPTEKQPRGFRIDPTGRFMVVTGEKSETVTSYAIDQSTGALKEIGKYPTGKGGNWVEIVSFD